MNARAPGRDAIPLRSKPRSRMIDVWRALACLAVVLFHGSETAPTPSSKPVELLSALGHHGWLGVPMFFVISGYCLAQATQRCADRSQSPVEFWADRLLRIYPVYLGTLFLACFLALIATPFNGLPASSAFPPSALSWLSNLTLTTSWLGHTPQLTVSWSLDFEIGFYVLMGAALFAPLRNARCRLTLYAAVTVLAHLPPVAAWFPVLGSWPAFACGLAVHTALQTDPPRAVRALAPVYPFALLANALVFGGSPDAVFAPAFALCLLVSLTWEKRLPTPPRALCAVGLASYSIYLIHIPVMSPIMNLARRVLATGSPSLEWAWLVHLFAGVAAGLLFYQLVERRCEALRARVFNLRPPANS